LIVNLIEEGFENYLSTVAHKYDPYIFTAVGMALLFVSIYFLFVKMEEWVNKLIEKLLRAGKHIVGKKVGIFIAFFMILFIIYWFYAKMWYNIDIWLKLIS